MKTQQHGFSVIELVISMMLASMLMTASLTIYHQITQGMLKMQTMVTTDTNIMIFKNRLSAELLGLCPLWYSQQQQKESEKKPTSIKGADTAEHDQDASGQLSDIENPYFYAKTDRNSLLFTFITTNPLAHYPYNSHRCVRVVYKLEKDSKNEQLFCLKRKEEAKYNPSVNQEQLSSGTFYAIVNHVAQCNIEYGVIETQKKSDPHPGAVTTNITWTKQWKPAERKKSASPKKAKDSRKADDEAEPKVSPDIIKIQITTQENPNAEPVQHELQFPLIISGTFEMPTFTQAEESPQDAVPTKTPETPTSKTPNQPVIKNK